MTQHNPMNAGQLIIRVEIGDTSLLLSRGGFNEEVGRESYLLSFRDILTDKEEVLTIYGENDAMLTVAAWIAADETQLGDLEARRTWLRNNIKTPNLFMP